MSYAVLVVDKRDTSNVLVYFVFPVERSAEWYRTLLLEEDWIADNKYVEVRKWSSR